MQHRAVFGPLWAISGDYVMGDVICIKGKKKRRESMRLDLSESLHREDSGEGSNPI